MADETFADVETAGDIDGGENVTVEGEESDQLQGSDEGADEEQERLRQQEAGALPPGDQNGAQVGQPGGQPAESRANARIRESVERATAAERRLEMYMEKHGVDENGNRRATAAERFPAFAPPEGYEDVHKTLGGYMDAHVRHTLGPVVQGLIEMRNMMPSLMDNMSFYRRNPEYAGEQHAALIERAYEHFRGQMRDPSKVTREDVLGVLRGHPEHGHLFAKKADPSATLDRDALTARRGASRVGGKSPIRSARGGEPDLAAMSPQERVRHLERAYGNEPF